MHLKLRLKRSLEMPSVGWWKEGNIFLVVVLNFCFYLAPFISNTFNIFLKIQINVLFLHRKNISPNIITTSGSCPTVLSALHLIWWSQNQTRQASVCFWNQTTALCCFTCTKKGQGSAWNKQEAQCFSCNLGYLYGPWVSELWERSHGTFRHWGWRAAVREEQ